MEPRLWFEAMHFVGVSQNFCLGDPILLCRLSSPRVNNSTFCCSF